MIKGKNIFCCIIIAVSIPTGASAQDDSDILLKQYETFQNDAKKEYVSFRDRVNKKYADFMEKAWNDYHVKAPVDFPIKREIKPIPYKKEKEQERPEVPEEKEKEIIPFETTPTPQPKPVEPIEENEETIKTNSFTFYGTKMSVRWGNAEQLKLTGHNEKAFAKAYRELTGSSYNNLINDCLKLREKHSLCDWAYFKMLQSLSEAACGKGTNEAVFLQGYLFHQSGYTMRYAINPATSRLHLLCKIDGIAYERAYLNVNDDNLFLMDGSKVDDLKVCEVAYPGEQAMNLNIYELPRLSVDISDYRTISSSYVSVEAKVAVNKNLINFFKDYPPSYCNGDLMTCWAYYANTPVSKEIKDNLYPQLRKRLGNATPLMAANLLLNWVQMGLKYAVDEKVWGYERAFFAEETFFYPLCDCEDRAILYSHLVRDLLGLDALLVYHPGHLYTAVCFNNEDVQGDYFIVEGRKFMVADPTYYMANVGKTMSNMDNSKAKVILLKK